MSNVPWQVQARIYIWFGMGEWVGGRLTKSLMRIVEVQRKGDIKYDGLFISMLRQITRLEKEIQLYIMGGISSPQQIASHRC